MLLSGYQIKSNQYAALFYAFLLLISDKSLYVIAAIFSEPSAAGFEVQCTFQIIGMIAYFQNAMLKCKNLEIKLQA